MKGRWLLVFVALAGLAMEACAPSRGPTVSFTAGVRWRLTQPGQQTSGRYATHWVEIERRGTQFRFQAHAEMEPGRLALVGLTPLGSQGIALVLEGDNLEVTRLPFYRMPISPPSLLAAYQWMMLPPEALAAQLEMAGLTLVENEAVPRIRRFYRGKREVARVVYEDEDPWQGRVILHNFSRAYRLIIDTKDWGSFQPEGPNQSLPGDGL